MIKYRTGNEDIRTALGVLRTQYRYSWKKLRDRMQQRRIPNVCSTTIQDVEEEVSGAQETLE